MIRLVREFDCRWGGICCLATVLAVGASVHGDEQRAGAQATASAEDLELRLEQVVDKPLDIELSSGTKYQNATLLRIAKGRDGNASSLRVRLDTGRSRSIRLAAIRVIAHDGQELYRSADDAPARPKSKKELKAEEEAKQKAQEHEQWLGRLTARGIKPWSEITEDEHEAMIRRHKEKYEQAREVYPDLYMVETEHYLFCSNMPQPHAGMYVNYLDELYTYMRKAYGLDDQTAVWCGKASVYAFKSKAEFVDFEQRFMENPNADGPQGLCHSFHDRSTIIACYIGDDPYYFGAVLVHETSHGFVWCYKTPERLPSWVNEGMAENIAMMVVTKDRGVKRKIDKFIETLSSSPVPRLGEDFFVLGENIQSQYYGGASSMVRFLMVTDQKKFVRFVDLLKEGVPWEEALQTSYNATKEELVAAYGRWIGVPNLRL